MGGLLAWVSRNANFEEGHFLVERLLFIKCYGEISQLRIYIQTIQYFSALIIIIKKQSHYNVVLKL